MTAPTEPAPPVDPPTDPPAQVDPPADPPKEPDWKAEARKWEQRAKENNKAKTDLEKLQQAAMSDQEKAVATARTEAATETAGKFQARILAAEIDAAVAGKFSDDEAAALIIAKNRDAFLVDGDIDSAAIRQAAAELVASGRLKAGEPARFQGGADQGPRDRQNLTVDEQIREAESKGEWQNARLLKAQKLSELPHS